MNGSLIARNAAAGNAHQGFMLCNWYGHSQVFSNALQLGDAKRIATPADWRPGDKVIIPPSISNEDAKDIFPQGWDEVRSYLRLTEV